MDFSTARAIYLRSIADYGPGSDVFRADPVRERSRRQRGVWYLRCRHGALCARVSRGGVRFAGWGQFAAPSLYVVTSNGGQ